MSPPNLPRGVDARTTPRVPIRMSAEVHVGGLLFTATTRDLSMGGMCLESDRSVPEGAALQIGLFLVVDDVEDASQPPLELAGKVAWTAPGEEGRTGTMGIRFEGITPAQMAGLSRLLKSGAPPQPGVPPPLPPRLPGR